MMSNTQVLCLIILLLDFRSLAQRQGVNPTNFPDCQCAFLFNRAGQGNCNRAGAKSHSKDQWCYIAENVNGRKVEAQAACPDSVRSSVHTGRFWSNVACETPTPATSSSPITYREPLEAGESLSDGQCEYTCLATGGCTTELVVDWLRILNGTGGWYGITKTGCTSSYNNGICGVKINGCNDCNKVIDCKTAEFPVAIEELEGKACSLNYSTEKGEEYGEFYYGDLFCSDKCIGTDPKVPCFCEKMRYREGKPVGTGGYIVCEDKDDEGNAVAEKLECYASSSDASTLFKRSAVAGSSTVSRFLSLYDSTKEEELCGITQCWRHGKCCDILRRKGGNVICPRSC